MTRLALLLWLGAAGGGDGHQPLTISIYPHYQVVHSSGTVRVRLIIDRDDRNRRLRWQWESEAKSGASERQLDGAESPRVWTIWLTRLPSGEYMFTAWLFRTDSLIQRRDMFVMLGQ